MTQPSAMQWINYRNEADEHVEFVLTQGIMSAREIAGKHATGLATKGLSVAFRNEMDKTPGMEVLSVYGVRLEG